MDLENSVLIIIDLQNDFCPGGALAVNEGDKIVPVINNLLTKKFKKIIATQDWHPKNHISFAVTHKNKKIGDIIEKNGIVQYLWPEHCVAGSKGADFHPDLITSKIDLIIRKGTDENLDSYSAFLENDKKTKTGLDGYLKSLKIEKVFLCGLATDYCVFYSAIDSKNFGFETYVILDASRGVDLPKGNLEKSLNSMKQNGIKIINSKEL